MMNECDFSVVVPVYNSVDSLGVLFGEVNSLMAELNASYEVIFVQDGGNDASWEALLAIKKAAPSQVKIVKLSRNFGQNGATLCGLDEAIGAKVITIDDDLQTRPEEIKKLIARQTETGADVIYGVAPEAKTSWLRRKGGNFFKRVFNKNQGGSSIGSSFRLIEKHIVDSLKFHSQDHLFINQVINWYTLNIEFVEVEHNERQEGTSGYSFFKLAGISFRLILYYSSIPLKIMVFFCLITAVAIVGMTIYYLYYQFDRGAEVDLFMISVLAAMAIIAASIAVFGVYINRIYSARVKKPNYSVKVKL